MSAVAIEVDEETGEEEDIHVLDEGYDCPEQAVGRYEIEVYPTGTMEFEACLEHAQEYFRDDIVVERVELHLSDDDTVDCPHCGATNQVSAVDHQNCCHDCREDIHL
jgi:hypothetical protein